MTFVNHNEVFLSYAKSVQMSESFWLMRALRQYIHRRFLVNKLDTNTVD